MGASRCRWYGLDLAVSVRLHNRWLDAELCTDADMTVNDDQSVVQRKDNGTYSEG